MPSPFPGMDPYLEQTVLWPSFHNKFANRIQETLNPVLPPGYIANIEPYIEVGLVDVVTTHLLKPDVTVEERAESRVLAAAPVAIAPAPVEIDTVMRDEIQVVGVRIVEMPSSQLVTVIEILSPINKRSGNKARDDYLHKREELLDTPVHLIEIDFLRLGQRVPMSRPLPDAPYFIILGRGNRRPTCEVWPLQLTDPLPTIPVPLLPGDPDVPLDLAAVFREAYDASRFGDRIDYRAEPPGPLSDEQRAWLKTLLVEKGLGTA